MKSNHWLMIYDISDPKRLHRVSNILESYATRVQYSVFEGDLPYYLFKTVKEKIDCVIDHQTDSVIYFNLCEPDWQKRLKFGPNPAEIPDHFPFIFL